MKAILFACLLILAGSALGAVTWTGAVSENWHTPGNWFPAVVPTYETDVVISNTSTGYYPRISITAAYCRDLQIDTSTNVHIYTNALNVTGNLSVAGYIQMSNDPCALYIEHNATWQSGSQAILSAVARVYCDGNMTFAAGSQFNQSTGTIEFRGTGPTTLINHSFYTQLPHVVVNKPWAAGAVNSLTIPDTNTQAVRCVSLTNRHGSTFIDNYWGNLYVYGDLTDFNTQAGAGIRCNAGYLITIGTNQTFTFASTGSYLNELQTYLSGTLNLASDLVLKADLVLNSGIVEANNHTLYIAGHWRNNAGANGFLCETGTVVFNGTIGQSCATEDFYKLTLNKSAGYFYILNANVTCASYTWLAGPFTVASGSFTAVDLAQARILGSWFAETGGTINLHQDSASRIDLCASLNITGGNFRVYGGSLACSVADGGDASIYMNGGVLDFVDNGIQFGDYLYSTSLVVTGGTLRSSGRFWDDLGALTFTGGTVELYGTESVPLKLSGYSSFYNLVIAKTGAGFPSVSANSNLAINHDLSISSGSLIANHHSINCGGDVQVSGNLQIDGSSILLLRDGSILNVHNGGHLSVLGNATEPATITRNLSLPGFYAFNVLSGGSISASYAIFEYMNSLGVNIQPGALVDTNISFDYSSFRLGQAGGALLSLNNSQNLVISGAEFPTNTWSGAANVAKTQNQGRVHFSQASGGFAGENYDNDAFNRIDWGNSLPPVTGLTISYDPGEGFAILDWTYAFPCDNFCIYSAAKPEGPWSLLGTTLSPWPQYSLNPADHHRFFYVTAVRD